MSPSLQHHGGTIFNILVSDILPDAFWITSAVAGWREEALTALQCYQSQAKLALKVGVLWTCLCSSL